MEWNQLQLILPVRDFELVTNKISSRIVSLSDTQRLFISLVDDDSTTKEILKHSLTTLSQVLKLQLLK